jgi:SAM-dependent methyltransferase
MTDRLDTSDTPDANAYFSGLYSESDDPWLLRDRWYERRKRALTLAALPDERYRRAYEPGCANGELTLALASRCDVLLAADLNRDAVDLAQKRVNHLRNVTVERRAMPESWPDGTFDLIVISEVAYYLNEQQLADLADRVKASLSGRGTLLACHWRKPIAGWPYAGDYVHKRLADLMQWPRMSHYEDEDFLLDVWSPEAASVHTREAR